MKFHKTLASCGFLGLVLAAGCSNPPAAPALKDSSSRYSGDASSDGSQSSDTASESGHQVCGVTYSCPPGDNSAQTTTQQTTTSQQTATDANKPVTPCDSIDWNKLSKPEDINCLGSKEKVFANIPDFVKPYWSLVKSSRSAQSSTLDKPRVLVFSPELSFIIGGATDDNARNDLEIAVFNYDTEAWDFAGIDFSTNPPKVERDLCKTCHSSEPRPIWERYGDWPNIVSASHDGLSQAEVDLLAKFRNGQGPSLTKSLKYRGEYKVGDVIFPDDGGLQNESNEMLDDIQGIQAGRSLAAKIMKDDKVSADDRKEAMKQLLCGNYGEGASIPQMTKIGYPIADYLFHGINGKDRGGAFPVNPYLGTREERQYVGIWLAYKMMQQDASLKAKMPEVSSYLSSSIFSLFTGSSVGDRVKARNALGKNMASWNADFLEKFLGDVNEKTDVCKRIMSL